MRIIWFPADGNTYPWEDIASLTQNYVSQAKPLLGADVQADDGKMALLLTLPSAQLDSTRDARTDALCYLLLKPTRASNSPHSNVS